jgi:hypothetical protein
MRWAEHVTRVGERRKAHSKVCSKESVAKTENITKVTLKNQNVGCGLDSSVLGQGPQAESCKHGNAYLDTKK